MPDFIDHTGKPISVVTNPSRIVSVVPSLTELLNDLGLDHQVAGITKFCVHPRNWLFPKTKIGGTKSLDIKRIQDLRPDLIIANKEENEKAQIEKLDAGFPVWVSDIHTIADALKTIEDIGLLTGKVETAHKIVAEIKTKLSLLKNEKQKHTIIYLIWQKPYMTVGGDTFIHSMIEAAGFDNLYKHEFRYPSITLQQIADKNPDYIFLSSEPFPFKEKHALELKQELPGAKIVLADGEMFSWYGSRMLHAPSYFLNLRKYGLHGK